MCAIKSDSHDYDDQCGTIRGQEPQTKLFVASVSKVAFLSASKWLSHYCAHCLLATSHYVGQSCARPEFSVAGEVIAGAYRGVVTDDGRGFQQASRADAGVGADHAVAAAAPGVEHGPPPRDQPLQVGVLAGPATVPEHGRADNRRAPFD